MEKFDKVSLGLIREEMNEALKTIGEKHGIKLKVGNASYTTEEVTFKVKGNIIAEGGKVLTKEAKNWEVYAGKVGLGHLSVGDKVRSGGMTYIIEGYNTRAHKSPVMVSNQFGKQFKCNVNSAKAFVKL